MRMIHWMCGHTRLDRITNVMIRNKVRVKPKRIRWEKPDLDDSVIQGE